MPNIQYWLGEVHYAQKKFEKAILEFGEGLKNILTQSRGQTICLNSVCLLLT